jgi:hypothetical protein
VTAPEFLRFVAASACGAHSLIFLPAIFLQDCLKAEKWRAEKCSNCDLARL